uniref:V-type proton ATPase subunit C n=1 Tax=Rhizochromulina marina TaxID=1034831 RepID=A0A7S2WV40_9STRA
MASAAYWMVTLPNEGGSSERTLSSIKAAIAGGGSPLAVASQVEVPGLLVGTLDSLMSLSDELGKHDSSVESLVRKIERQYSELTGKSQESLKVYTVPPARYLQQFSWDIARFPPRRPLPQLIEMILSNMASVEEEMKQFNVSLSDATQNLAALQRKKGGNLTMMPLDEILTPDVTDRFVDTEYLKTVCVVVPKSAERDFLATYHQIGEDIAGFGGPDWAANAQACGQPDSNYGPFCERMRVAGSPAVPGSAQKLATKGDQSLFSLVLLKGQYEGGYVDEDGAFQPGCYVDFTEKFQAAAREKRFVVREFVKEENPGPSVQDQIEELERTAQSYAANMRRWCQSQYGEVLSSWIHLKVIRCFVESVLRYGLPPNFTLAVLNVQRNKETALGLAMNRLVDAKLFSEEDGEDDGEYHEYCRIEFTIEGAK